MNWDGGDNLLGSLSGDPYDPNIDQLFVNSIKYVVQSGHGYFGEFNGAAMAYTTDANGFAPLNLIPGIAGYLQGYGPQFVYHVGPIGSGNPIDAGVTFPFTDLDNSTYWTQCANVPSSNVVLTFNDGTTPALVANSYVINGGGGRCREPTASSSGRCSAPSLSVSAGGAGGRPHHISPKIVKEQGPP